MYNIIIMGAGRSGTSLTALLFKNQGFSFPSDLIDPTESNPDGFFESYEVNRINEALLQEAFPNYEYGQRWLAALHKPFVSAPSSELAQQMRSAVPCSPFVLKDPRFSYTLDAWLEHTGDCRFICVFRNPVSTVNSIQKMLTVEPYLRDFNLSRERTFTVWNAMYDAIVSRDRSGEHWLFLEYESMFSGNGLQQLSQFSGVKLETSLVNPSLQRSDKSGGDMPIRTALIYRQLLALSQERAKDLVEEPVAETV